MENRSPKGLGIHSDISTLLDDTAGLSENVANQLPGDMSHRKRTDTSAKPLREPQNYHTSFTSSRSENVSLILIL